jgi:hypothetical protein
MPQTKAQRSASAKKAAATRKRNKELKEAQSHSANGQDALRDLAEDAKSAAKSFGASANKLTKAASLRVRTEIAKRSR